MLFLLRNSGYTFGVRRRNAYVSMLLKRSYSVFLSMRHISGSQRLLTDQVAFTIDADGSQLV